MRNSLENFLNNPEFIKISIIIIAIVVVWFLKRLIQKSLLSKINDNDNRYKANKLGTFIGYFIIILLLIVVYNDKLGEFNIAIGVAGAGIAFALQEVIISFAGWLTIMFSSVYKTGDRVQLAGIKGDVMDISVLRTTIMETGEWVDGDLYNGRIVLIANSFVFKEPVFNYSGDFPFLWDEIKIPIQYNSNYDKTKQILENAGKVIAGDLTATSHEKWKYLQSKYRLEDAKTEPIVSLIANDNWVEFTLRYVVSFKKRRVTKTELFTKILKDIEATKGEIRFASATFQIVEVPEIKVKLTP